MKRIDKLTLDVLELLRKYEPLEGYYLAFSGGKDSIVSYDLLVKSGCKFDAHFNVTTIDPPKLLRYMKLNYPKVIWDYPIFRGKPTSFCKLIETQGLPSRQMRWCCELLKEYGGFGRFQIDGLRSAESFNRSKRKKMEYVFNKANRKKYKDVEVSLDKLEELMKSGVAKKACHIIFSWSDKNIWDYIHANNMKYCSLYDEGFHRIGCIGCPNHRSDIRKFEFSLYPRLKASIIRSIGVRMSNSKAFSYFDTAEEVFDWWVSGKNVYTYNSSKEQVLLDF